jgi:hypothetical protein
LTARSRRLRRSRIPRSTRPDFHSSQTNNTLGNISAFSPPRLHEKKIFFAFKLFVREFRRHKDGRIWREFQFAGKIRKKLPKGNLFMGLKHNFKCAGRSNRIGL